MMSAPDQQPRFHAIMVVDRHNPWLEASIAALESQTLPPRQITLHNNGAPANAFESVGRLFPALRLMHSPERLSFAAAVNKAASALRVSDFILLQDPDVVLALNAVERLTAAFQRQPQAGIIGCKVLGGDVETIAHVGIRLRGNGLPAPVGHGELDQGQYHGMHDALTLQTGAMAIRTEVWCELGGLDESFYPAFYERIDLCLRSWAHNWAVSVAGDATGTYFGSNESHRLDPHDDAAFFRSRARLLCKHYRRNDWIRRFLPDEIRWLTGLHNNRFDGAPSSRGRRWIALKSIYRALSGKDQAPAEARVPVGTWPGSGG